MNRPFFVAASLLLGASLRSTGAIAQPNVAPDAKPRMPSFSVAELEEFLDGRTLLTLDLQNATLEQVAAALGESSGQKITVRPTREISVIRREGAPPFTPPPVPLFTLSTSQKPFWEALRALQLDARRAAETANALDPQPGFSRRPVPHSVGLQPNLQEGWWLQADNALADGRAVAAWPFLIVATDIKRSQEAKLSEAGLREIESWPAFSAFPPRLAREKTPVQVADAPKIPVPEAKRWLERLMLSGQAYADPKLNPTGLRCEVEEAIDDKGNDLRLADENALNGFGSSFFPNNAGTPLQIPLRSQPGMGKRLVRLRGVLRFNLVTRSQHWETTQLDTPIEGTVFQNGGEFKVQFKGLEKSNEGWSANFSAESRGAHLEQMWHERANRRSTSGPGFGSFMELRSILSFQGVPNIRLVDDSGRVFEPSGGGSISALSPQGGDAAKSAVASLDTSPVPPDAAQNWRYEEKREIRFNSRFDPTTGTRITIGKPTKLVLDLPLERREVSVPFEFTDLPLPPS